MTRAQNIRSFLLVAGISAASGCQTQSAARPSNPPAPASPGGTPGTPLPPLSQPTVAAPFPTYVPPGLSPTATVGQTTGGSGGVKGKTTEVKSSIGLKYYVNAPDANGPTKAHGLLVLLHGSGASNYREFVTMMAKVSEANELIPVSVLAPNGGGWNEGDQVKAAGLLNQLIQSEVYTKYNINKSRVLFSGQSSGGGFLSSHFVPLYSSGYQGGAFLQCGAAPPQSTFKPSDETKQKFRLHFEITTGDPIWPASYKQATAAYQAAGMQLTKDQSKPGGHCAFDQQQVIVDHIKFVTGG